MSCLPCFESKDSEINEEEDMPVAQAKGHPPTDSQSKPATQPDNQKQEAGAINADEAKEVENPSARNFGFREVAMATHNFKGDSRLGESAFGKVYKGTLPNTGQVVAVKQLDKHGTKANKEFLAEVISLSLLRHPNLAKLIGYCADGDQRILVYEFMQKGSLKDHLHEISPDRKPLDWITRMKIASGAAQALEYLHEKANPPVLYRNFKSTNILLDENLEPKLTDYGLMKFEIESSNTMRQRLVGTVGCAPEYEQKGEITAKSDVYSFGIVLLELITGRKALDTTRPTDEQNLVIWAQPYFKDQKRYPELADPELQRTFPERSLNQAVGVAAMCVQEEPSVRPFISDIVAALSFLTVAPPPPQTNNVPDTTNDPHEETHSSWSSSSSFEPEQELEAASTQKDGSEYFTSSDYEDEDEDEQSHMQTKNNNKNKYDEDRDATSSSESLYNEDDYDEDESQQEETSYRSKSKPKSIKRKVTFEAENKNVRRNSSKGNKTTKTNSGSSMRKKSVNRRSSKNDKKVDGSLSKKCHDVSEDDQSSSEPGESYKIESSSRSGKSFRTRSGSSLSKKILDMFENNQSSSESDESNSKSSPRRPEGKKMEINESSESSFSSDSGESSRKAVTLKS